MSRGSRSASDPGFFFKPSSDRTPSKARQIELAGALPAVPCLVRQLPNGTRTRLLTHAEVCDRPHDRGPRSNASRGGAV